MDRKDILDLYDTSYKCNNLRPWLDSITVPQCKTFFFRESPERLGYSIIKDFLTYALENLFRGIPKGRTDKTIARSSRHNISGMFENQAVTPRMSMYVGSVPVYNIRYAITL
jgi:hypothetical protein